MLGHSFHVAEVRVNRSAAATTLVSGVSARKVRSAMETAAPARMSKLGTRLVSRSSFLLEPMAVQPQQQRDHRAARKQQLNGQIRAGVARELNQCVHCVTFSHLGAPEIRCHLVEGMLLAVRIPLISDHDRFVARSFRIHVKPQGAWRANLCIRWAMNFRSPTCIRAGGEMPHRRSIILGAS
jgi:hypothetical protein